MSKNRYSLMTAEHVEVEELDTNKAKISVYPFETGHAITLAHPLRRLLMSSSVGFAPIAVKIENIAHYGAYARVASLSLMESLIPLILFVLILPFIKINYEKEILTLFGPTGSGKTTLLRLIAGLESPDEGEIFIDGEKVSSPGFNLPPSRRGVNKIMPF